MTDKIEEMTLETLPHDGLSPEVVVQLEVLRHLAQNPGAFRLVFFHLPNAALSLHTKYALLNEWTQKGYDDIESISVLDYTAELVEAIYKGGNWVKEMCHYQEPQVLLVDDLIYLLNKESTQESFVLNLLKPRIQEKKLTVLFSQYPLSEMSVAFRDDLRDLLRLAHGYKKDKQQEEVVMESITTSSYAKPRKQKG